MKNIFKTIITICICLLLIVIALTIKSQIDEKVTDKGTKLASTDPVVVLLQQEVTKNTELRFAKLTFESLSGLDFVHYALL